MKKIIGDNNKLARAAAVSTLVGFKGRSVETLNINEIKELLAALLQLLGLADPDGNIK